MPSLKYYDPTALAYKYLVGGLSQETADARYLTSGFRNVIRNGDMSIAQKGNGPFTTGVTGIDGWLLGISGGTMSVTRVAQLGGGSLLTAAISGQGAAGDVALVTQRMEGVGTLAGQTVTVSFLAKAVSGTPKIAVEMIQFFGTGGSPSGTVWTSVGAVTISTTLARYSLTFVVPSVSGKTVGTSGTDRLDLNIWLSAGSSSAANSSGIGIQNNTFSITDVQLEAGSVATPFERLPMQQQLAWCQRYFQRLGHSNPNMPITQPNEYFGVGVANSATAAEIDVRYVAPMRTAPTVTTTAVSTFNVYDGANGPQCTALSYASTTPYNINVIVTTTSMVVGRAVRLYHRSGETTYIDLSAEL